jgi:hypothetical protein
VSAAHTPGPWFNNTQDDFPTGSVGTTPLNNHIALCWSDCAKADARLIAAAPDLLAAVQLLVHSADAKSYQIGRAAIAKATGEQA